MLVNSNYHSSQNYENPVLPIELHERILNDYPKKTELCKSFKINEVRKNILPGYEDCKKCSLVYLNNVSFLDLYFAAPNLEELDIDSLFFRDCYELNDDKSPSRISCIRNSLDIPEDFKIISMFPNLKTLKLSNFTPDDLYIILDKISECKALENLELDFSSWGLHPEHIITESSFIEKISYLKNLKKLTIKNYDTLDSKKIIDDIGKLTQITDLSYSNYSTFSINNNILKEAILMSPNFHFLPRQINNFYLDGCKIYSRPLKSDTLDYSRVLLTVSILYGLYSLIKGHFSNAPSIANPSSVSFSALPSASKQLDTLYVYAIGFFLALSTGLVVYYSKFGNRRLENIKQRLHQKKTLEVKVQTNN